MISIVPELMDEDNQAWLGAQSSKGGTRVEWSLARVRTDELVIRIRRRGEHPRRGCRLVFVWIRGPMMWRMMDRVEMVVIVREETGALGPG
jgi:hypothetical protein